MSAGLTFTQQSIADYLRANADRWVAGAEILRACFTPRHDPRNVRVQILRAKRRGAPIESCRGRHAHGYRWCGSKDGLAPYHGELN